MRASSTLRLAAAVGAVAVCGLLSTSSHTVLPGETLSGIAAANGTSVDALAFANGIADPNVIVIGDRIAIPTSGGSTSSAAPSASGRYVVRSGDTIAGIAQATGISISRLVAANGITDPNFILIGDRIVLPASGGSSSGSSSASSSVSGGYTVKPGDTILGIALAAGISTDQLVAANGLVDGWIYESQRLQLGPARDPGPPIVCPVPGASFVNDWGFPRTGHYHAGNDLFAPAGTPIYAPRAGTVTTSTSSLGGKQVRVVPSDGMHYHATHLGRFGSTGWVEQGDVIGYVGSSGNARGGPTHVHFEVEPDGLHEVSPYPLLVDACR